MHSERRAPAPDSGGRLWWQIALFIAASTAAVFVGVSFDREVEMRMPEGRSHTSSFNIKGSGYSGLLEIARRSGLACRQWQQPYRQLGAARGTLFIVQPESPPEKFESDQILEWVAGGNAVIYLDYFAFKQDRHLLDRVGVSVTSSESTVDAPAKPAPGFPEFAHVGKLVTSAETRLKGGKPMLTDKHGALLTVVTHGKGHVYVGVTPNLCANRRLNSHEAWGNFQLAANLLRTAGGDALFDEKCHGYTASKSALIYLSRGPVGLVCMQLLLLLAVAFASASQRFGRVQTLGNARKISNQEFVEGLTSTYLRARAAGLVWQIILHDFRLRLGRALGVAAHDPDERFLEAWSRCTAAPGQEVADFLRRSQEALDRPHLTNEELAALVSSCDKITAHEKELFATRKGTPA